MRKGFICAVVAAGVICLLGPMTSCEKYILPRFSLTRDTLRVGPAATIEMVGIESNVAWKVEIEAIPEWVVIKDIGGEGDFDLEVRIVDAEDTEARKADIPIASSTIKRILVVEQEGLPADPAADSDTESDTGSGTEE